MFLLSSALKNEDFIFKKKEPENELNKKKITTKELLCGNINFESCQDLTHNILTKKNKIENNIIDSNAYDDLEIFKGIDKHSNSIFNTINKTKTIFGNSLLKISLNNPTTNIETLKKNKKLLKN